MGILGAVVFVLFNHSSTCFACLSEWPRSMISLSFANNRDMVCSIVRVGAQLGQITITSIFELDDRDNVQTLHLVARARVR